MNIEKKLEELVKTYIVEKEELKANTDLFIDLGIDSISMINLIVDIESEFNIEIEDDDLDFETISQFGNLCLIVEKYLNS